MTEDFTVSIKMPDVTQPDPKHPGYERALLGNLLISIATRKLDEEVWTTRLEPIRIVRGLCISFMLQIVSKGNVTLGTGNAAALYHTYPHDPDIDSLSSLWTRWRNNLHQRGTQRQRLELLRLPFPRGGEIPLVTARAYLKKMHLIKDRGYIYGSQNLYEPMPEVVVDAFYFLAGILKERYEGTRIKQCGKLYNKGTVSHAKETLLFPADLAGDPDTASQPAGT